MDVLICQPHPYYYCPHQKRLRPCELVIWLASFESGTLQGAQDDQLPPLNGRMEFDLPRHVVILNRSPFSITHTNGPVVMTSATAAARATCLVVHSPSPLSSSSQHAMNTTNLVFFSGRGMSLRWRRGSADDSRVGSLELPSFPKE
ncbi:hypothetical protein R1sor_018991 [Riccia sorocarpa]|uniref:Uncharacterized protein n=1 Tax=Riccia sorocarpa TaxID=122646 RepID=A0ABD3IHH6_9MARC